MIAATTGAPTRKPGTRLKSSVNRKTAIWYQLPRAQSTNMWLAEWTAEVLAILGLVETTLTRKKLGSGQTTLYLDSHSGLLGNQTAAGVRTVYSTKRAKGIITGMMRLALAPWPSYAARRGAQVGEKRQNWKQYDSNIEISSKSNQARARNFWVKKAHSRP